MSSQDPKLTESYLIAARILLVIGLVIGAAALLAWLLAAGLARWHGRFGVPLIGLIVFSLFGLFVHGARTGFFDDTGEHF